MGFAEKLKRLTSDRHKRKLAVRAGLRGTAIYDYISKGSTPSALSALKIARALEVDLAWLVDDERDWPPVREFAPRHEPSHAA